MSHLNRMSCFCDKAFVTVSGKTLKVLSIIFHHEARKTYLCICELLAVDRVCQSRR